MPPTTNNLFRTFLLKGQVRRALSQQYRVWLKKAVKMLTGFPSPAAYPVELRILLLPGKGVRDGEGKLKGGWRVNNDVSNRIKAIEDAMVKAEVIPTDDTRSIAGVRIGVSESVGQGVESRAAVWFGPSLKWWEDVEADMAPAHWKPSLF